MRIQFMRILLSFFVLLFFAATVSLSVSGAVADSPAIVYADAFRPANIESAGIKQRDRIRDADACTCCSAFVCGRKR